MTRAQKKQKEWRHKPRTRRSITGDAARRLMILRERGTTQAELAERLECSQSFICQMIHGRLRSDRLEKRLARILRVKHADLFPEHYENGDE